MNYESLMHGSGESYCGVVLAKQPNKSERSPAEVVEGRPQAKENTPEPNPYRTRCRICGSHGLARVREAASVRFDAKRPYPRQEPCALVAPARVCAEGRGQPLSLPRPPVPLDQTRSFVRRTKAFDNRDRPTRASAAVQGDRPTIKCRCISMRH